MTRIKLNGILIIEAEPDGTCQTCGKTDETRPYGPNGSEICFQCAFSTPERAEEAKSRFIGFLND